MIEGSSVSTRHGNIDTSFILFIASGAFHSCKPSDMLAELQVCRRRLSACVCVLKNEQTKTQKNTLQAGLSRVVLGSWQSVFSTP